MKEYTDGKRTIWATERAYNVIYKQQGFRLGRKPETLDEMYVTELRQMAKDLGIEECESMKKAELLKAIKELTSQKAPDNEPIDEDPASQD